MTDFLYGADRLDEYQDLFKGKRLGLISSPTGVLSNLTTTIDNLNSNFDLRALYSPEHGIRGDHQDGASIGSYIDKRTGKPVYSIYGEKREPSLSELDDVDVLIYDIQDIGSRYYTFIYSMVNSMRVAKDKGIPFVILDRPNPIGGLNPEGSELFDNNKSFIGMYDYPQRYSLTAGEYALMVNKEYNIGASVFIVPMKGWKRSMYFNELGVPWINPSPNIASFESIILYNGTAMFEGTNLSEGRGTTRPFELIGAPWLDSFDYADCLNSYSLPGVLFRPASFIPQFHKYQGEICNGVQVHVTDAKLVKPVVTGIVMLKVANEMGKSNFKFTAPRHEIGDFTIDLMYGSSSIRNSISLDEIYSSILQYSKEYSDRYKEYWIYNEI